MPHPLTCLRADTTVCRRRASTASPSTCASAWLLRLQAPTHTSWKPLVSFLRCDSCQCHRVRPLAMQAQRVLLYVHVHVHGCSSCLQNHTRSGNDLGVSFCLSPCMS